MRSKRSRSQYKSGLPSSGGGQRAARDQKPAEGDDRQRLQKVMAAAGVGSRRDCEQLIVAGRVSVDGHVVIELGTRVDPQRQEVRLDGELLKVQRHVYYLVNKPAGVVSTNDDPAGRPRVVDLIPATDERLFTVGRLDLASEGLMLVTNDGELAQRLAHPRYGVEKTYQALVAGRPSPEALETLRTGVHLAEGFARVENVRVRHEHKQSTVLEIVLAEGKNREIRRLLARVGHKVMRLRRVALGPLRLKDLEPGEVRRLTADELRDLSGTGQSRVKRRRRPKRGPKVAATTKAPRIDRAAEVSSSDAELARRHPKPAGAKPAPAGLARPARRKGSHGRRPGAR
ncbi:MAG TPA: pseudouridine synthase [Pirellulales bacterium]|jgi:23S rRNA pseudouridine2605 synthase|nr:pseudouridine synthase [Pirellulales bacterium]